MRTHLRPDGTPMPFNDVQLPISQLSISQPEPQRLGTSPSPDLATLILAQKQNLITAQNLAPPIITNPASPHPDTTLETAAAIFSAAATGQITPQMMLSTLGHSLDAQIPNLGFRRSTPNIFQSLESTPNSASAINAAISRLFAPQPALSRQSSIGGFGFIDATMHQTPNI
jgi:hypothetical protein